MSRIGFVNPVEQKEFPNEISFSANIKLPAPAIETTITVYMSLNASDSSPITIPVSAFAAQDMKFNVNYVLNKRWRKIFVTEIKPESSTTFRTSFKCETEMTYDFCLELQSVLNDSVFNSIEPQVGKVLKFKLEELDPVLS